MAPCNKDDNNTGNNDFETLQATVLTDLTNVVAVSGYQQWDNTATNFDTAIQNLNTSATEANLTKAKNA